MAKTYLDYQDNTTATLTNFSFKASSMMFLNYPTAIKLWVTAGNYAVNKHHAKFWVYAANYAVKKYYASFTETPWHSRKSRISNTPRLERDKFANDKPIKAGFRNPPQIEKILRNLNEKNVALLLPAAKLARNFCRANYNQKIKYFKFMLIFDN